MNEGIPDGWVCKKLGSIAKIYSGGTPSRSNSSFYNGSIPWVKSGEVNRRKILWTSEHISDAALRNSSARRVGKGSILIAMYGATAGKVSRLLIDATINQAIAAVSVSDTTSENDYMFHQIEFQSRTLLESVQGSGQPNLSGQLVKELKVLVPPLPEQKKIAAILTSVDDVIENTQAQIAKLQDLKKATMNELLTKGIGHTEFKDNELGRIPKSWETKRLSELIDPKKPITYGIVQAGKHIENGVPYIRVSDMKMDALDPKKMLRTAPDLAAKFERSRVRTGDIVYALRGDVGRVLQVPHSLNGANLTQGTALISKSDRIDTQFLIWCLKSETCQTQSNDLAKGSTFVEMTLGNLRNIRLVVAPYEEQIKISSILNSIRDRISLMKLNLRKTQSLKKALMNDLLTGKVRVNVN